jgi:hypothetical protein
MNLSKRDREIRVRGRKRSREIAPPPITFHDISFASFASLLRAL